MSKVLVISGHPDLAHSYTNSAIIKQLEGSLSSTEIRRLDTLYPDYQIDIEQEQKALINADIIILQFPFYWYSVPALLKKWIDDVFSYDFAFGAKGDKLKGKDFILSFTVGGPESSYTPLGYNHFPIGDLVKPLQQTAYLAGMVYHQPVYTHQMVYIPGVYNELEDVVGRANDHANRLIGQIKSIQSDKTNLLTKFVHQWFSEFDVLPEDAGYFLSFLAEDIHWEMGADTFTGHAGFNDWYQIARNTFLPGPQHIVEQVEVEPIENDPNGSQYQLNLRIRFIAETAPMSEFKGNSLNVLVNETWTVSVDENDKPTIHRYLASPVES